MSTNSDFDRIAAAWLVDGPVELSDRVLDAALREVHETPQRRPLRLRRVTWMSPLIKLAAAGAALVAIVAVGSMLLPRGSGPSVGASPSPAGPSLRPSPAEPSPGSSVALLPARNQVQAGTYQTDLIRPTVQMMLGWSAEIVAHDSGFVLLTEPGLDRHLILQNPRTITDPATGDTAEVPDDLGAWFESHPWLDVSDAADVTVGGLPARRIDGVPSLDADYDADGVIRFTGAPATPPLALVAGERFRLFVLKSPEGPFLAVLIARADRWDAFVPQGQAVIDSLRFVP